MPRMMSPRLNIVRVIVASSLLAALAFATKSTILAQGSGLTGTLVVVNKGANTANIIDIESGEILATLPTGNGPHEVAISSDGKRAVVTDYGGRAGGNTLTIIDVPKLAVERKVDLGQHARPHGIAFLPGDELVAVTSEDSRHVVLVRVTDGEIVSAIPTDQRGSHMLAAIASGELIYTSNIRDNSVSELVVADASHTRTFAVPEQPEAIGVTPDGSEVWVGSNARGTVSVVDTSSREVDEALGEFSWPYRILFTPDQRLVLIPDLRKHQLRIIDREGRNDIATLSFDGAAPQGITLTGDGKTVLLTLSQRYQVAISDLETRQVIKTLNTGARPDGVVYTSLVLAVR